ncbi:GHMP kinase [Streptomyces venezuelae]|uniref:GHMP family kinase ATP-binding protein n=1 Tax=Streptomyces gardneri TaxID=66892 RepID=UPI0006BCC6F5|nr:GHMP kinase [Streptomyces gardneri]ALO12161.1 GHMP kinase [Streptomyces venezuelae]QPK48987.1 GHMP kinase [Streptomyces gardneri]WRK40477.1 GHMP kinase [Streptomyces venezuelae]CUM37262.1 Threonine kinase in B12 biosynthesis [Streptomyces venezuelae]
MIPAAHPRAGARATVTGTGSALCHHGEILQGVFLDDDGRRCAGLVTLPMAGPGSRAEFVRAPGTPPEALAVVPAGRSKAARAAVLAVAVCAEQAGQPPCGGELRLTGDIPVGLGMGSSTSDVIAAVRAVADSYGSRLTPGTVARLAVRAELACDPLMLDGGGPVLFAQREGRVLEALGPSLPPLVVVGCLLGGGAPVDTLALPAYEPDDGDVRAYERLRARLRRAMATGDVGLLGEVATASARRGQRILGHPEFDALAGVARRVGAAGVQIAHSGAVAGVLFDPSAPGVRHRVRDCLRALDAHGIAATRTFTTSTTVTTTKERCHGPAHRGVGRPAGPDTSRRPARLPAL